MAPRHLASVTFSISSEWEAEEAAKKVESRKLNQPLSSSRSVLKIYTMAKKLKSALIDIENVQSAMV